jgi:hypothetical protein
MQPQESKQKKGETSSHFRRPRCKRRPPSRPPCPHSYRESKKVSRTLVFTGWRRAAAMQEAEARAGSAAARAAA